MYVPAWFYASGNRRGRGGVRVGVDTQGNDGKKKVVVVGSGPSGLTAALYAARADLAQVVVEGFAAGGQLMLTTEVENYPGFADGVMGPELMAILRKQAGRFGATFITDDATAVDLSKRPFSIEVGSESIAAESVIVSTGASARMLGIPSEQKLLGRGVSTCATCDGAFFRGQPLVIVGGGDSAMEEALFLTRFASTVTVVHRRDKLRASKIMQDRAFANEKISFIWNSAVDEVLGDGKVSGVRLRDVATGETSEAEAGGVFVAIGHDPNSSLFRGQLDMDANGYLLVGDRLTHDWAPGSPFGTRTNV